MNEGIPECNIRAFNHDHKRIYMLSTYDNDWQDTKIFEYIEDYILGDCHAIIVNDEIIFNLFASPHNSYSELMKQEIIATEVKTRFKQTLYRHILRRNEHTNIDVYMCGYPPSTYKFRIKYSPTPDEDEDEEWQWKDHFQFEFYKQTESQNIAKTNCTVSEMKKIRSNWYKK